jgi:hypothetical protein
MEVGYSTPVIATGALTCLPALGNSGWTPTHTAPIDGEKRIGFITDGSHQDAFRDSRVNWLR